MATETQEEPGPTEMKSPPDPARDEQAMPPSISPSQEAYDQLVRRLRDTEAMTSTAAWLRLWDFVTVEIEYHTKLIFDPECSSRQVMEHRETVLAYKRLQDSVKAPLAQLREMEESVAKEPLFPFRDEVIVKFDDEMGVLRVTDVP